MAILARLGVVLGLDSAEFQQGLAGANMALQKFQKNLPQIGAIAATSFAAATYKALSFADSISDAAKASDVAIGAVLALSKGLQANGGEAENAGKMLSAFSVNIDEAAQGSATAQKAFARVGVSLSDLAKLNTEELFDKTVKAIAAIEDPAARAALATSMFGKAAKGVDFVGLAEGSDEAKQKYQQYALAVEQAADLHDKLEQAAGATSLTFTNAVIPTLLKVYDALSEDSRGMEMVMEATKFAAKFIADAFHTIYTVVMSVVEATIFLKNAISAIFTDSTIAEEYEKYNNRINDLIKKNMEFRKSIWTDEQPSSKGAPKFSGRVVTPAKDKDAEKIQKMLDMAKLISVEYKRHLEFNLENLKTQGAMLYMTENQRKVQEAISKVSDDVDKKLDEIQKKREEAAAHGADKTIIAELDKQAQKVRELGEAYKELTQTEIENQIAAQRTFSYGWSQALKQYQEDSQNAARFAGDVFNTITGNMNSAIDNFVRTGKLSFKDFAQSILQDLIAIQLKMQAMQLFAGMGGVQGMWSSLTGGQYTPGSSNFVGPMPAAADGGYINGPTLVGENGPEIFIPQAQGTVIPNQQMSSAFGNQPQVVYNGPYIANMSAIDTQSAAQFLSKNKTAVWAANQSAQRALPVSR